MAGSARVSFTVGSRGESDGRCRGVRASSGWARVVALALALLSSACEPFEEQDAPRCDVEAVEGPCIAGVALAPDGELPPDVLSEQQIAACTDAEGGRNGDGALTQQGATCIARALGLNPGIGDWDLDRREGPDAAWLVDTVLSSERDCCREGCYLRIDANTGRPIRAVEYLMCP